MIEAEVHLCLHNFLRSQAGLPSWHHHLTMARLVARTLRTGRSSLIQVGATCGYQGLYRTSFVASALIWHGAVIIVATEEVQQRLLRVEIPRLQQWLQVNKPIRTGDTFPGADFSGLLLISPRNWLKAQLSPTSNLPENIPTIIDGVDDLEDWVRQELTVTIPPPDWEQLQLACPQEVQVIRNAKVQLTHEIFQHPANPYECYLISSTETEILQRLYSAVDISHLLEPWHKFWDLFANLHSDSPTSLCWTTIARRQGLFSLHCSPLEVDTLLAPIWQKQPVVLIGSALEADTQAPLFRQRMGLEDVTCLKFSSERQTEAIQLYIPYQLPLPNTPQFQPRFMHKLHTLICLSATAPGLTVVLVGDVPLRAQVGSILAAQYGSRVQVEKTCLDENSILISGWEFWRSHQNVLPSPQLLIVSTLPLPSLEHPLVAGRVSHYKRSGQDWFRLYLLPTAINELERAIAPVREGKGIVALLDSRVVNRSYGAQVLAALSPVARINYLDPSLFSNNQEDNSDL
ncbi:MAG: ATP-dependent DNA helicase [Richelia sp.]|nr:ATP-dependent DNA helicase [Richelia sp.]